MKVLVTPEESPGPAANPRTVAVGSISGGTERAARRLERQRGLPSSRAVVGALLMALAAIGTFVAYTSATADTGRPVAIARRALVPGSPIRPGDVEVVTMDVPASVASRSFDAVDALVGRVALGPIAKGEVLQRGGVTDAVSGDAAHEVSFAIPRANAVDGRLRSGDLVDVFVTYDERTTSVVRRVQVRSTGDADGGSITSDREVTLTLAIPSEDQVVALVHAIQAGDITVVRSTFAAEGDDTELTYEQAPATTAGAESSG